MLNVLMMVDVIYGIENNFKMPLVNAMSNITEKISFLGPKMLKVIPMKLKNCILSTVLKKQLNNGNLKVVLE